MTVLSWDKPARARSREDHEVMHMADGAPPGTYVPNMSKADQEKWKAKLVGKTTDSPQVEIRRTFQGSQMLLIVSLGGGYKYGSYSRERTQGINGHLSMNGPCQMTFDDMTAMQQAVAEARTVLENLSLEREQKGDRLAAHRRVD